MGPSNEIIHTRRTWKASKLEPNTGDAALGAVQVQADPSPRFFVSVTSFRRRLIDEDNLCEKYHVDLCRYAGIIPGDQAETTSITAIQKKVGKEEEEKTRIEVLYPIRDSLGLSPLRDNCSVKGRKGKPKKRTS